MSFAKRKQDEGSISRGYKGNMCTKSLVVILVQQDNICAKVLLVLIATGTMGSVIGA